MTKIILKSDKYQNSTQLKLNLKDSTVLQNVLNAAIDGIIIIDQRGIIQLVNSATCSNFQYTSEEMIGNNVKMIMADPHRDHHDRYIENYQKEGHARIIGIGREVQGLRKDGSLYPLRIAVSELSFNTSKTYYLGVLHDLTDVHNLNKQLKEVNDNLEQIVEERTKEIESVIAQLLDSNQKLEENKNQLAKALSREKDINELKSRFVSMASHEFKTPLSTIKSSAALIAKYTNEEDQDKREKHSNRIQDAVNHLTTILNDFLSLSKIEAGGYQLKSKRFDIHALINLVVNELDGILPSHQHIIVENLLVDNTLQTDKNIVRNILFNLLSNAIKYSEKDITIKLFKQSHFTCIDIIDQGIGIPINEQKLLFERFFRATNAENIAGTGLGLHIVKEYMTLLNGKLSFESDTDLGSTFTIKIPNI